MIIWFIYEELEILFENVIIQEIHCLGGILFILQY